MITSDQYLARIAKMRKNIYINGEVIGRDDPRVVKGTGTFRVTFDRVQDPEYRILSSPRSHISGKPINRWTHINQSPEDLMNKQLTNPETVQPYRGMRPEVHGHRLHERPVRGHQGLPT